MLRIIHTHTHSSGGSSSRWACQLVVLSFSCLRNKQLQHPSRQLTWNLTGSPFKRKTVFQNPPPRQLVAGYISIVLGMPFFDLEWGDAENNVFCCNIRCGERKSSLFVFRMSCSLFSSWPRKQVVASSKFCWHKHIPFYVTLISQDTSSLMFRKQCSPPGLRSRCVGRAITRRGTFVQRKYCSVQHVCRSGMF